MSEGREVVNEHRCVLPTIREEWQDDYRVPVVEHCGEPLHIISTGTSDLSDESDPSEPNVEQWHIECEGGHVVVRLDIEDRSLPFNYAIVCDALDLLKGNDE